MRDVWIFKGDKESQKCVKTCKDIETLLRDSKFTIG